MPRGKNYVNNNKGMRLQAYKDRGGSRENVACIYGAGCNRKDCIYRHPPGGTKAALSSTPSKSKEPCMAFLAGNCTFTAGCVKRHPPREECDRLRKKYKSVSCRFGDNCKTVGCLYMHPSDVADEPEEPVNYVMPNPFTLQQAEIRAQSQQQNQQMDYQRQMHLQMLQQQRIYQQQAMFYQAQQQTMHHQYYGQQFPPMGGGDEQLQHPTLGDEYPPLPSVPPMSQDVPGQQTHQDVQSHAAVAAAPTAVEATASEELSADAKEWSPCAFGA